MMFITSETQQNSRYIDLQHLVVVKEAQIHQHQIVVCSVMVLQQQTAVSTGLKFELHGPMALASWAAPVSVCDMSQHCSTAVMGLLHDNNSMHAVVWPSQSVMGLQHDSNSMYAAVHPSQVKNSFHSKFAAWILRELCWGPLLPWYWIYFVHWTLMSKGRVDSSINLSCVQPSIHRKGSGKNQE